MDTLAARQQMVDQQIRTWEVLDPRVLDALSAVPREAFVPPEYRELAFADAPIPIGFGQSMLAPEAARAHFAGSRHQRGRRACWKSAAAPAISSACFSLLGASTRSIDIHAGLIDLRRSEPARACRTAKVQFEMRDAFDAAPLGEYDVVAVTGSLPVYDTRFERSLARRRPFIRRGGRCARDGRRPGTPGGPRTNGFAKVCSRPSSTPLINATAAQKFVF